jgi:type III pantothenate kinase
VILFIDSGNTRTKWRLADSSGKFREGFVCGSESDSLSILLPYGADISRVAVSMVGSDQAEAAVRKAIKAVTDAPVHFYWAERQRFGLVNSYRQVFTMGADRWHAMVGAWSVLQTGFAVVDAGSAVTVDYVRTDGAHLGGYILPGLMMMRRSLKMDAARIGFEYDDELDTTPGQSTSECTNHGIAWLTSGVIDRVHKDCESYNLGNLLVTGGDADRLLSLGLDAEHRSGLVLEGLERIDRARVD